MPAAPISKLDIVYIIIYVHLMPSGTVDNLAFLVGLNQCIFTIKWLLSILFFLIRRKIGF